MRITTRLLSSVINRTPFYITTPIFYVNASPHIGHLYTALVADAIQRFEKLTNPNLNVIFATGTDEHGTKIQKAAEKAKQSLPEYCSSVSKEYRELFNDFDIGYTQFIRTSDNDHRKAVTQFWNKLVENDYIYKAKYSGWYSVNDECFVPDSQLKDEVRNGENVKISLESGHIVEWTEETNYMFRLSAFKTHLLKWLKEDGVVRPQKFQKQLLDYLQDETYFPDISVSRPASRVHWAIPVPDDGTQSVYVWVDALVSYVRAAGGRRGWPADLHVLGKDILKFHGIYWPALLMAAHLPPPRRLLVHSHWTVEGSKMSKSVGNVVSPRGAPAPAPALRYLLLREATMHQDANYSETKLLNTVNAELADTLGNLASRSTGAALNPRSELPPPPARVTDHARELMRAVEKLPAICHAHYTDYQFHKAVDSIMRVLHLANLYFETEKPWELRKKPELQSELDAVLHITLETLRICGIILQPIIPGLCEKLLDKLAVPTDCREWRHCEVPSWLQGGVIHETKKIQSGKFVLFQRIYTDKKKLAVA